MRTTSRMLAGLVLSLVLLSSAIPSAAAGQLALAERGNWDELAQWLVPRFVEANRDFASIIENVRRANCSVDVELTSAALESRLTGVIRYDWEDFNDSGMLSGRELRVEVQDSSSPIVDPYLHGLRDYLEDQTIYYFPFLFQINDIRAVRIPGGYKLRLRPASDGPASNLLDYDVSYLTLTSDFRATELRAQSNKGVETVFRFKHRKIGDKWLSAGYLRRITTPTARAEEDRTEVYDTVGGVHLLKEVNVDTFVATANGAARVHQKYTFRDWEIEKRDHTVVVTGIRAEGIMTASAPREITGTDFRVAHTLKGHANLVLAVAYSPTGKQIASAGMDKTIKLWNPATATPIKTLTGHTTPVSAIAYTADGKRIVSGAGPEPGNVRVWDTATGKQLKALDGGPSVVFTVACSPDGKQIVAGGEGGALAVWDAATYKRLEPLVGHLFDVYSLAYTPPNPLEKNAQALLVSGSADRTARLWKVADTTWPGNAGENFGTLTTERQVASVAASWNGQHVAAAGTGKAVMVWETATGRLVQSLAGHTRWIESIAFSPVAGSTLIASGSRDRWIRVWDYETGKCIQMLEDHDGTVRSVAFSPDGNSILSGSDDRTVKIWTRQAPPPPPKAPAPAKPAKDAAKPKK